MSLVEQALKKAKEAGQPVQLATAASSADAGNRPLAGPHSAEPPRVTEVDNRSPETDGTLRESRSVSIDLDALRRVGYVPPPEQEREISEQFRHIKRPLLARAFGRSVAPLADGRVIMISSALPGEGKTFCSINLARSLCLETDSSVLIVDADTARPQFTRAMGLLEEPGLVDALQDSGIDVETLVATTSVSKLSVLPAGRTSDTAAELLASARMIDVLRRLTSSQWPNRIVILDSPPLLVTNEAKTLVDCAGQVVLVVRASSTPQSAVLDAISHLREDQFVGLILNESNTVAGVGYGYGYYSHIYQYGQSKGEQKGGSDGDQGP
jgi:protein-tyrosine kinase